MVSSLFPTFYSQVVTLSTTDLDQSPGDLVLCSISSDEDDSVDSFYVTSDGKPIDILNRTSGAKAMLFEEKWGMEVD